MAEARSEDVRENPAKQRFELAVDGAVAFAEYRPGDGILTFIHTEVPEALAGRGIASRLIKGALDQVRARGLKVVAKCDFVRGWIGKHPEYSDLSA
jgi:predicted GNAT family acetyltransferase